MDLNTWLKALWLEKIAFKQYKQMTSFLVPPCALAQERKTLPLPPEGPRLPVPSIYTVVVMSPALTTSLPAIAWALRCLNLLLLCPCSPPAASLKGVFRAAPQHTGIRSIILSRCFGVRATLLGDNEEEQT